MANIEKNKQYIQTEEKIEEVYRSLRKSLPIEKVTISKICKEANINRSSFYYHYLDIYDLNDKLIEKMNRLLSKKMEEIGRDFLSENNLNIFFQHIKDEKETYKLTTDTKVHFPIQRSYNRFKEFLLEKSRFKNQTDEELDLSIIYVQAGLHFMVRSWLENDCKLSSKKITKLFLQTLE